MPSHFSDPPHKGLAPCSAVGLEPILLDGLTNVGHHTVVKVKVVEDAEAQAKYLPALQ